VYEIVVSRRTHVQNLTDSPQYLAYASTEITDHPWQHLRCVSWI